MSILQMLIFSAMRDSVSIIAYSRDDLHNRAGLDSHQVDKSSPSQQACLTSTSCFSLCFSIPISYRQLELLRTSMVDKALPAYNSACLFGGFSSMHASYRYFI